MIRFVDLEQGSQEWLEFRKGKIGSSMAASIVGKGFKTPLQLFEEIMEEKETPVNEAMLRGTRLEPVAREFLNEKYNANLQPVVIQHPNPVFDWHISSLDGFWEKPDGSIFVCEIKCPGRIDHQCALDGKIPEKYVPQLLHILEDLPEADGIFYFSYHEDSQAEIFLPRDNEEIHHQFSGELSFYNRLLNCRPPDPTDRDWIHLTSCESHMLAERYQELKNQIENLQQEKENLREQIIESMGNLSRAKIGDFKIQKVIREGAVDYSKIEDLAEVEKMRSEILRGMDLSPYRADPIVSWRLT